MAYKQIRCEQKKCKYGTSHCCFGEYDTLKSEGKQIVERHKCKQNKKEFVLVTITPDLDKTK